MRTVWVMGDQLNRSIGALAEADPSDTRVLLVESKSMLTGRRYHRQRLHLVLSAMRRFAGDLEDAGFDVDYRQSRNFAAGLDAHRTSRKPSEVVATEPNSRTVRALLARLGVTLVRSDQFLCHPHEFREWADDARGLKLENFYRWQRRRLGLLMDDNQPAGGRWNFDHDNREPPPADGGDWSNPVSSELTADDRALVDELPATAIGNGPIGIWATSRRGALARLRHFVDRVLPGFGPHEDAMLEGNWHLAHSLLSPYLNLGLLLPGEVCEAVEAAYRNRDVPINSAEGMIRQVAGWREYVWGIYWHWPELERANALDHRRKLPPFFTGDARTEMRCLQTALDGLDERAYVHHIQRLMVLSNFANLYGIRPAAVKTWMRERYIDGADWVMEPNVMGMALWADGGRMATKPYVSGGAYIRKMSDYCKGCRFEPAKRTGDTACPFSSLYWDFLARHRDQLADNHRLARQYSTLGKLKDLDQTRARAHSVVRQVRAGKL